jgi:hypothetical protein
MSVETYADVTNRPFILNDDSLTKEAETVVQDAGRGTADMERNTLMSYDPATGKWSPFIDETETDGTQIPMGILQSKILAADIVAGDVVDVPILVGNAVIDQNQLVIEASKTLATVVNVPVGLNKTVEELLRWIGIFCADTIAIEEFENAPA